MRFALSILFTVGMFIQGLSVSAQTVYVTNTGKKYHTSDRRYLRSSKIPMSCGDAQRSYARFLSVQT